MALTHALAQDVPSWRSWADQQLYPMDLSVDVLHRVLEAGHREFENASPLSAPPAPGIGRWNGLLVEFRRQTGWRRNDQGNLPRTEHPSGAFYVVVATGAGAVGEVGGEPCPTPKNGLGSIVRQEIDAIPSPPPMQTALFSPSGVVVEPAEQRRPVLWYLLAALVDRRMVCELSRPSARVGDSITSYAQRIPIPPLEVIPAEVDLPDVDPDEDDGLTIEVNPL